MRVHLNATAAEAHVAYSAGVTHDGGFEQFARELRPVLLSLAKRLCGQGGIDPEDLVQETLERALRHFGTLKVLPEPVCRAWLCRALNNRFLDLCRRRRTEVMEEPKLRLLRTDTVSPDDVSGEVWEHISENDFRAAISRLPNPRVREAYELHVAGKRYRAIAQQMGVPEGTVGSWLFQARKELRDLLLPLTGGDGGGGPR
ncbi:RNA polymerase sigma factor [Myxococcaceae bacterium JPH2]|nr:RNA polymerase sigma factor [Myxococcaceae bacterium JPH2]